MEIFFVSKVTNKPLPIGAVIMKTAGKSYSLLSARLSCFPMLHYLFNDESDNKRVVEHTEIKRP